MPATQLDNAQPDRSDARAFFGVDGGGTSTRAVVVDGDGTVAGYGVAGPSNYQSVGLTAARNAVAEAVAGAAAGTWAGREARPATAAMFGMAGVASASDRETIETALRDLALAELTIVDHDIRPALAGALAMRPGIALIAGTGSAAYGQSEAGTWRAGGWGAALDDPGSGYWLGIRALAAMAREYDGRGPSTALTAMLRESLDLTDMDDLVHLAGRDGLTRDAIAGLAPHVLQAADRGDAVAVGLVAEGSAELAAMVRAVAVRLDMHRPEVAMIGGLSAWPGYRAAIESAIRRELPDASFPEPALSPAFGAALIAMKAAGISITPAILGRLTEGSRELARHAAGERAQAG